MSSLTKALCHLFISGADVCLRADSKVLDYQAGFLSSAWPTAFWPHTLPSQWPSALRLPSRLAVCLCRPQWGGRAIEPCAGFLTCPHSQQGPTLITHNSGSSPHCTSSQLKRTSADCSSNPAIPQLYRSNFFIPATFSKISREVKAREFPQSQT